MSESVVELLMVEAAEQLDKGIADDRRQLEASAADGRRGSERNEKNARTDCNFFYCLQYVIVNDNFRSLRHERALCIRSHIFHFSSPLFSIVFFVSA